MSRNYAKISTEIWNSKKFQSVTDDAKLVYLYLHTCKHANSVGCFVLKDGYAITDLGWTLERYHSAMKGLSIAGLVGVNTDEQLVRIVKFIYFEPFTNPKHAKGSIDIALRLPDCHQKLLVLMDLRKEHHAKNHPTLDRAIEGLSIGYRNQEQEQEQEQEEEKEKKEEIPTKTKTTRQLVTEILENIAGTDAVKSFIDYRSKRKLPLTEVAAKRIAKQLQKIQQNGGDPDDALGLAEEHGWRSIKLDWYEKNKENRNEQPNHYGSNYQTRTRTDQPHAKFAIGLAKNAQRYENTEESTDCSD